MASRGVRRRRRERRRAILRDIGGFLLCIAAGALLGALCTLLTIVRGYYH